jgi:sugar/nucleoside kinase (ribokinase family)
MYFPFKLSENKEFDVVGFGTNAVDYLVIVPQYPEYDSKIELTDYVQAAGGEIATTTVGLRRLGARTLYIGRFGDDNEGNFGIQTLRDEGVDVRFAERIAGARTQIAFIIIDERTGERTVIWKRDAGLAYEPEEVPAEAALLGKILHFTPHDARACYTLARAAKDAGAVISIDIDNIFEGIDQVLPLVDIFVSSAAFPERLVGIADKKASLREIKARYGCPVVGMTLGETGSLLLCGDEFIRTDGFEVPNGCKDTTGAGDSFRVGLLHGVLSGATVEESARMANAVAALKCRAIGARTALPNLNELNDLLKKV